jgi:hypothetical protein
LGSTIVGSLNPSYPPIFTLYTIIFIDKNHQ